MARLISGTLLKVSGRIGDVVICKRYGKTYLRSLPEKVNHPNTEKQLAQRMRFAMIQQFLRPILPFIKLGFGGLAVGRSAYNAAVSYNLQFALKGDYPDIALDYANSRVSRGNLHGTKSASLLRDGENGVCVKWEGKSKSRKANGDDVVAVLLFFPITGYSYWSLDAGKRSDGMVTIKFPEEQKGNTVVGYVCFITQEFIGAKMKVEHISDSCWCGEVEFN
jgi:hypothetical protein